VGYSIRFEDCTSDKTVLKYMTGAFLLLIQFPCCCLHYEWPRTLLLLCVMAFESVCARYFNMPAPQSAPKIVLTPCDGVVIALIVQTACFCASSWASRTSNPIPS
jgi:hypothetical protein